MPAPTLTDADIVSRYTRGDSIYRIPAGNDRIHRVLAAAGIPVRSRGGNHRPPPKPLNLDRRPSRKIAKTGAWIADIAAMTQGGRIIPQPLPETATRLRKRLYARRVQERTTA